MRKLLTAVRRRSAAYLKRGDVDAVLSAKALTESGRLWTTAQAECGRRPVPLQVVNAVAWLHWCRHLALTPGGGRDDHQLAVALFRSVHAVNSALVPAELRALLAIETPATTEIVQADRADEAGDLGERGAQLLMRSRKRNDLADAIGLLRRAVDRGGNDHPERHMWLGNLGIALYTRFKRSGVRADLDEAVAWSRGAVETVPARHAYRAAHLLNFGKVLREHGDLDAAIASFRAAIASPTAPGEVRRMCRLPLAGALHQRYSHSKDPAELDAIILAWRAALEVKQTDDERSSALTNLSVALCTRHGLSPSPEDADAALAAARSAAEIMPDDLRLTVLANLVSALALHLDRPDGENLEPRSDRDLPDKPTRHPHEPSEGSPAPHLDEQVGRHLVDELVKTAREALATAPPDDWRRVGLVEHLGGALWRRYLDRRASGDLVEVIACARAVVEASPEDGDRRASALAYLTNALNARLTASEEGDDLTAAVADGRWLLDATGAEEPERAARLGHLGRAHHLRFLRLGEMAELDIAITLFREAVDAALPDQQAAVSAGLGEALTRRFTVLGRLDDLIAAVAHTRAAVATVRGDHPARPEVLSLFSEALRHRYHRLGDPADLDAAVEHAQASVDATDRDDPARASRLGSLNNALQFRYGRTRDRDDLDRAIAGNVEAAGLGTEHLPAARSNLGGSLLIRYRDGGDPADLDAAITHMSWVIDHAAADDSDRAAYLCNLGFALHARFGERGDAADLEAAVAHHEAAVATGDGHRGQELFLHNLATALWERFERSGDEAEAAAVLDALRRAAAIEIAPTAERVGHSRRRGDLAAHLGRWQEAADSYARAVALLPLMAWRGLDRDGRQGRLAWWGGAAADAAACAITTGEVERAVVLLEQGRGVSWSQLLDMRTDLSALRRVRPELADRLAAVGAELTDEPALEPGLAPRGDLEVAVDRRIAAAHEWEELVAQVRAVDGFADFLLPPPPEILSAAAERGPVVIVNVSQWRCDALLVRADGVHACALPDLTLSEVVARAERYLVVLGEAEAADLRHAEARQPVPDEFPRAAARRLLDAGRAVEEAHERVDHLLADLQAWMWDAIAEPVLDALGLTATPTGDVATWPRVWWCPTGPLTLLPLHTAGRHGDGHRTVLDRVVSSYSPSLRALLQARRPDVAADPASDRLLLVDVPDAHGMAHIDSKAEREALLRGFPGDAHTVLDTTTAVRAALPHHRWAHFSCHGDQDLRDPSRGGLRLRDGVLTVADLSNGRCRGDFAGLSACKTAVGGVHLLDEVITLAAALHHTGFRHVVAALWSIDGDTSSEVFSTLYGRIAAHGRVDHERAPAELHEVVRRIRDRRPDWPHRWTPFAHIGP
ncbi:CHAT domain-containing protein [Lentzea waywayandensis]|uniref:CHAT domain-containing protein n=1 Tax=Lentzea waywayandensis TaxID=84724 RepID=A0A1I6D3H1_9PSEU|nr:CHAT domain-containing protein [Lentzea waywayandensis]SFR00016.1 CHAT domain-containing protein [Lentzea waywayandensis]